MLLRLPGRSAAKLLAETTCSCQQTRPARAGRLHGAPGRTRPQKFPSSPAATSLPAAVPARRPGALSLASSPLALPSFPPSLSPFSRLLRLHGCRTEPLNSHRSPPPPPPLAQQAERAPAPAGAPGLADRPPPSNDPGDRFGALLMPSHPVRAPRPRDRSRGAEDTPWQRVPKPRARSRSPLRASVSARLAHLAPGSGARVLLRGGCLSVPALASSAGRAAVRVSWRGCAGGCGVERWRRARGQLLPPGAAPPPSLRPASRAAAVSPEPRARCPRRRLGGRTGLKGPDVCGRLSSLAPACSPAAPSPPCHTCTCCVPASSRLR
jgi:hypothetical protein